LILFQCFLFFAENDHGPAAEETSFQKQQACRFQEEQFSSGASPLIRQQREQHNNQLPSWN